ncbi:MAG: winged helix-turn-helix transcriptional regulator [Dehalococcoidia bacterium]|nr:winged helix-turn-helix transcriptional regulator [Dehalococcoidia bacterium]
MLRDLLRMTEQGTLITEREIARRMGVSVGLVESMLGELVRAGYLSQPTLEADSGCCHGCSLEPACGPGQARLWCLTPKGREALHP